MFVKSDSDFIYSACGTSHEDMIGGLMNPKRKDYKNHGPTRTAALLLGLFMLLTGCGKKDGGGKTNAPTQSMRNPVTGEYELMESAASLTGVYRADKNYRYEGERLHPSSSPLYDPESGKLTAFSTLDGDPEITEENGQQYFTMQPSITTLRTLLPDGTCVDAVSLPMPEGHAFHHGGVAENGAWYLSYDPSDGTEREERLLFHCMGTDGKDYRCAPASAH